MARRPNIDESLPESDAFEGAPHPREMQALVGHRNAELALLDAFRSGRLPQAWIIGGPEGCGKATLAWRFVRFLIANPDHRSTSVQNARDLSVDPEDPAIRRVVSLSHGDLSLLRREWNSPARKHFSEIRIDDVRRALEMFHHASREGGWRICIVDCAEDLNHNCVNALLKIIEEPPRQSLFLIISHRPARVLPTIRSRSRLLCLDPLQPGEVIKAIEHLGAPWTDDPSRISQAAERSAGSVRQALRLLDRDRLAIAEKVEFLLRALPILDLREVHILCDKITPAGAQDDFDSAIGLIFDWIDLQVRDLADQGPARLAPLAEVWEKATEAVREAEVLNLDKRPLILSIFADLATATGGGRR